MQEGYGLGNSLDWKGTWHVKTRLGLETGYGAGRLKLGRLTKLAWYTECMI